MEMENEYIKLKIIDDILLCTFKPGLKINLPLAKEMVQFRLEFIKGQAYPTLVDMRALVSITKESREYFGGKEATHGIKALALWVESPFTKLLANFFIEINKPPVITQAFKTDREAIQWLNMYK